MSIYRVARTTYCMSRPRAIWYAAVTAPALRRRYGHLQPR